MTFNLRKFIIAHNPRLPFEMRISKKKKIHQGRLGRTEKIRSCYTKFNESRVSEIREQSCHAANQSNEMRAENLSMAWTIWTSLVILMVATAVKCWGQWNEM